MSELNLKEGERIIYECHGKLHHKIDDSSIAANKVKVSMSSGKIIITNYRIIAKGEIKVTGGGVSLPTGTIADLITDLVVPLITGVAKRAKIRKDLPQRGYEIPLSHISKLRKIRNGIAFMKRRGHIGVVKIKFDTCYSLSVPSEAKYQVQIEENIDKIFEYLSKFNKRG